MPGLPGSAHGTPSLSLSLPLIYSGWEGHTNTRSTQERGSQSRTGQLWGRSSCSPTALSGLRPPYLASLSRVRTAVLLIVGLAFLATTVFWGLAVYRAVMAYLNNVLPAPLAPWPPLKGANLLRWSLGLLASGLAFSFTVAPWAP